MTVLSKHLPKINVAEDMVELRHILLNRGLSRDEADAVLEAAVKVGMYYALNVLDRDGLSGALTDLENEYRYGVLN
jgi:hypothetical protein